MGIRGDSILKDMLMGYMQNSRLSRKERPLECFIQVVGAEFGGLGEVKRIGRMNDLITFKRDRSWDIRTFWRQRRRVKLYCTNLGVSLPDDIPCAQAIKSMELTPHQQQMTPTANALVNVRQHQHSEDVTQSAKLVFGTVCILWRFDK